MGQKKAPPKKSEEEKAAEKHAKLCTNMLKACKNDEVAKVEEALDKGADLMWANERGQTAAHMAAAFGALDVLRFLHKRGADFVTIDEKKMTPKDVAIKIGEDDSAALIDALLAGLSGDEIGLGRDLDLADDDDMPAATPREGEDTPAATPAATPREEAATAPAAAGPPAEAKKTTATAAPPPGTLTAVEIG